MPVAYGARIGLSKMVEKTDSPASACLYHTKQSTVDRFAQILSEPPETFWRFLHSRKSLSDMLFVNGTSWRVANSR